MRIHTNTRGLLAALATLALGAGTLVGATAAVATPAPDTGPTAGGTEVSDTGDFGIVFSQQVLSRLGGLGLDANGTAYAWGYNGSGQLGDGTTDDSTVPVPIQVPSGVTFVQLFAGLDFGLALDSEGNAWAWGQNTYGQLGDGTTTDSTVPVAVQMPPGVTFTSVSVGAYATIAIGSDEAIYTWGRNNYGQLGTNNTTDYSTPQRVTLPGGAIPQRVSMGELHALAVDHNGNAWAWGRNNTLQLGTGGGPTSTSTPVAVQMPTGQLFADIAASRYSSLALTAGGEVYAWGWNVYGQIGDGTAINRSIPVPVSLPPGTRFTQISVGGDSSYAVSEDGTAYAWGLNNYGQLGNATTNDASVPVSEPQLVQLPQGISFTSVAGAHRSAQAVGSDGNVYVWGINSYGQLGYDPTTDTTFPQLFAPVTVSEVTFGGEQGTNLAQSSFVAGAVAWSADTPGGCGPVDVTVTWTRFGESHEETIVDGFVYGAAPTASVSPASQEVERGGTFTATAEADGDDAPGLQWQERLADGSWAELAGETSETLTIEGVQADGEYRVVATNCWGSDYAAISDPATLTVTEAGGGGTGPGGGGGTGPGGGGTGGGEGSGGAGTGGDGSGAGGDAGAGTTEGGAKGAGSEAWLADTGSGLLWLGVALATAAASFGGILLLGRRRGA